MHNTNLGIIGLAIEVMFLGVGSLIYFSGFGAGPQGAVPMVAGIAVAVIGLLIGGILGVMSMMRGEGKSFASGLATILPILILAVIFIRRIGPL